MCGVLFGLSIGESFKHRVPLALPRDAITALARSFVGLVVLVGGFCLVCDALECSFSLTSSSSPFAVVVVCCALCSCAASPTTPPLLTHLLRLALEGHVQWELSSRASSM